jgi:phospholipid/cholesterol/gamma-HCH transport system substrate-binding protein
VKKFRTLLIGGGVLLVFVAAAAFAVLSPRAASAGNHQMQILFPSADGLVAGSDVLVAGSKVGYISEIQPTQNDQALVTVAVASDHWPMHQGLTAAIRPKSLLGEKYVDLHDGPQSAPAYQASAALHAPKNSVPVELDQFINSLDAQTRTAVRVLLDDLGAGVAGRGPDLNTAIAAGKADLEHLAVFGRTLNNRDPDLDRILVGLDGLLGRITTNDQLTQISQLITNGQNTLNDIEAVQTVFSRQFNDANIALTDLNAAFDNAVPSLRSTLDIAPALLANLQTEAGLLSNLGSAVLTVPPGCTGCPLPIDSLISGIKRGPTVSGGALEFINGQAAYPIFRICLSNLPGLTTPLTGSLAQPSCDNTGSAPTAYNVPGFGTGAGEAAAFAAFMAT